MMKNKITIISGFSVFFLILFTIVCPSLASPSRTTEKTKDGKEGAIQGLWLQTVKKDLNKDLPFLDRVGEIYFYSENKVSLKNIVMGQRTISEAKGKYQIEERDLGLSRGIVVRIEVDPKVGLNKELILTTDQKQVGTLKLESEYNNDPLYFSKEGSFTPIQVKGFTSVWEPSDQDSLRETLSEKGYLLLIFVVIICLITLTAIILLRPNEQHYR
jgi:hypothetical protein